MKKPGHQQAGEERAEGRRRELPPKSALATSPDTTLDNGKGGNQPETPLEELILRHYYSGGSSSHATVPKLGKRIAAMGQAPCIFSCESHWISKTVTGKLLHTQDVNKDNWVPL